MDRLYRTANSLFKTNGYKPTQSATAESQDEDVRTIIGLALNRKQIGPGYHTDAYPYFMRSQGPFKVYDHAQQKGSSAVTNLSGTNAAAHTRFQDECERIKENREYEREQFGWQKHKADVVAAHNHELRRKNNRANLHFVRQQIEVDRERKSFQKEVDRQYYKPHFGPEETQDLVEREAARVATQKEYVRAQLLD